MKRKRNLWVSIFLAITILLSIVVNVVSMDIATPCANKDRVEFDHDIGYYAYYYNIDSVYGDMYWQVHNSNITPEQKDIFVSYDDNVFSLVENYADCVDNMIRYYGVLVNSAKVIFAQSVYSTISIVVTVASGNIVSAIAAVIREVRNIAKDVEEHIVNNMAKVSHYAELADDYYSSIPDYLSID